MAQSNEQTACIFRTKGPKKLNVGNLKVIKSSEPGPNGQKTFFVNVKHEGKDQPVIVQTDSICLVSYGIPKPKKDSVPGSKIVNDSGKEIPLDSIKLPLDDTQQSCKDFRSLLDKLDTYFGSSKFKDESFGKAASQYSYSPLIKKPIPKLDDNDEVIVAIDKKTNKPYPQYDCCKLKFSTTNDSSKTLKTKLLRNDNGKDVPVVVTSVEDISKELTYKSEVKVMFQISRAWANSTKMLGSETKLYGVSLKVLAILYTKAATNNVAITDLNFQSDGEEDDSKSNMPANFDDESDDSSATNLGKSKNSKDKKDKKNKKSKDKKSTVIKSDSEKEDSDNEVVDKKVDSDDEENQKPSIASDDEDENEDEPPVVENKKSKDKKTNDKKKAKKVDSSDDDDVNSDGEENQKPQIVSDDEDESPVVEKKKSKDKKKAKKVDSSDDEEEEVVKPPKKKNNKK